MPYKIETNSASFVDIPDSMPIRKALDFAKEHSDKTQPLEYIDLPDRRLEMPKGTSWAALDYLDEQGIFRDSEEARMQSYMGKIRHEAELIDKNLAINEKLGGAPSKIIKSGSMETIGKFANYGGNLMRGMALDLIHGDMDVMPNAMAAALGEEVPTEHLPVWEQGLSDIAAMWPEIALGIAAPGAATQSMMFLAAARRLAANDVSDAEIEKPLQALRDAALTGAGAKLASWGSDMAAKAMTGKVLGKFMGNMGPITKEATRRAGEAVGGTIAASPADIALDWEGFMQAEDKGKFALRSLVGAAWFAFADMSRASKASGIDRMDYDMGQALGESLKESADVLKEIETNPELSQAFREGVESAVKSREQQAEPTDVGTDGVIFRSKDADTDELRAQARQDVEEAFKAPDDTEGAPASGSAWEALARELESESLTKGVDIDALPDADSPNQTPETDEPYVATEFRGKEDTTPYKTRTDGVTPEEASKIYAAYQRSVKDSGGFVDTEIASIANISGVPVDKVRDFIWSQSQGKDKNAFLSEGDWSMSPEWVKEGTIWHKGKHYMKVRLEGKPKFAEAKPSQDPVSPDQALRRGMNETRRPQDDPEPQRQTTKKPQEKSAGKTIADRFVKRVRENAAKSGDYIVRITPPGGQKIYDWVSKTWRREFTKGGNLSKHGKAPTEANDKRMASVRVEIVQAEAATRYFKSVIKKHKLDKEFANENSLLSRAIRGLLTNDDMFMPKTDAHWKFVSDPSNKTSVNDFAKMRAERALRMITSQKSPAAYKEISDAVNTIRDHRDAMTQRLLDTGMFDGDPTNEKIVDLARDVYFRRTYKVFRDNSWHTKLDPVVLERGEKAIARVFGDVVREQEVKAAGLQYKDETGNITPEATRFIEEDMALPRSESKIKKALEGRLNMFIKPGRNMDTLQNWIRETAKVDQKPLKSRSKLLDTEPDLRALMGEDLNPIVNYLETTKTLAGMAANYAFMDEIRQVGLGSFIFEPNRPMGEQYVELAGDGYGPLKGHYVSPEFKQALDDTHQGVKTYTDGLMKNWAYLASQVKMNLTVFSFSGHIRNYVTMPSLAFVHGHLDPHHMMKNFAKAHKVASQTGKAPLNKTQGTTESKFFEEFKLLTQLRVIGESVNMNDLKAYITHIGGDPNVMVNAESLKGASVIRRLKRFGKNVQSASAKMYEFGDAAWKLNGFYVERDRVMAQAKRAGKQLSEAEANEIAAERIRKIYPSYSEIPPFIKRLRLTPAIGSFVSWPYEVGRTTVNLSKMITEELRDPTRRRDGLRRLSGVIAGEAVIRAAQGLTQAALGITEEQDKSNRWIAAPWDIYGRWLYLGKNEDDPEKGPKVLNLRNLDYFTYIKEPIIAALSGANIVEGGLRAAQHAMDPFISKDIFTNVALEAIRGETNERVPVWYSSDEWYQKAWLGANHIWKVGQWGTLKDIQKIMDPDRNTWFELKAFFTGQRPVQLNPYNALKYGGYKFKRTQSNIKSSFKKKVSETTDPDVWLAEFQRKERRYRENFMSMHKAYVASRNLGMTRRQAKERLRQSGINKEEANDIANGRYHPYDFMEVMDKIDDFPYRAKKVIKERLESLQDQSKDRARQDVERIGR